MRIPVKQAAHFFVYVSAAGILGKILFLFAALLSGRRRLGPIHGFGTFVALAAAAYFHSVLLGGISIFVVTLAVTDSSMPVASRNLAPYTPEAYGVRMGRGPPASAREPTAPARSSDP
jgi:putative MFS transporter